MPHRHGVQVHGVPLTKIVVDTDSSQAATGLYPEENLLAAIRQDLHTAP